jgi:hypothetical protein
MNCKPGDLAIVTGGARTPGLAGMIVEVQRPYVDGSMLDSGRWYVGSEYSWVCRSASGRKLPVLGYPIPAVRFVNERAIADSILRPIRPSDLVEPTETDVKKPHEVSA